MEKNIERQQPKDQEETNKHGQYDSYTDFELMPQTTYGSELIGLMQEIQVQVTFAEGKGMSSPIASEMILGGSTKQIDIKALTKKLFRFA